MCLHLGFSSIESLLMEHKKFGTKLSAAAGKVNPLEIII